MQSYTDIKGGIFYLQRRGLVSHVNVITQEVIIVRRVTGMTP